MLKHCFGPSVPVLDPLTLQFAVMFCTVPRSHITLSHLRVCYCKEAVIQSMKGCPVCGHFPSFFFFCERESLELEVLTFI